MARKLMLCIVTAVTGPSSQTSHHSQSQLLPAACLAVVQLSFSPALTTNFSPETGLELNIKILNIT